MRSTPSTTIGHEIAAPPAPRKPNLRSTRPFSPVRPLGWGEKANVPPEYDPQAGIKPRRRYRKKTTGLELVTIDSESASPKRMADNESKPMPIPGAWQKTPSRIDSSQPRTRHDDTTTTATQDSLTEPHHHDDRDHHDDARAISAHLMTDVTPAIRRIRQLRDEVLLEKRGTSPRDERHKELERKLAALGIEEEEALRREEKERRTDEFIKKTLEEERALREHSQHQPLPTIPPTWEERMEMAETHHRTSDTIVHQPQPTGEAIMAALAQLTNAQQQTSAQMNRLGYHLEQVKDQLSSRMDRIETSSNRSRSRSGSRHSSPHRPVASENSKFRGLPTTVEDTEDEADVHREPIQYGEWNRHRESVRQNEKIQHMTQADDLEKSLSRTRNERLLKVNLIHHKETLFPVLSYRRSKIEDAVPITVSSVPFETSHTVAPRHTVVPRQSRLPQREERQDLDDDLSSSSSLSKYSQADYHPKAKENLSYHPGLKHSATPQITSFATQATPSAAPLVQGSFYKLNAELLGNWDPAIQPTYAFTASIMQARLVYGDMAVVAAIPIALSGQAKKWFRSLHTELYGPRMSTVEGWVDLLENAFPVDRIKTRKEA